MSRNSSDPPDDTSDWAHWSEPLARALIGNRVVIGITRTSHDDVVLARDQYFGKVVAAEAARGIDIALEGASKGETLTRPPSPKAFQLALPGQYRLRSTGEVVEDPDYTTSWTIVEPAAD